MPETPPASTTKMNVELRPIHASELEAAYQLETCLLHS